MSWGKHGGGEGETEGWCCIPVGRKSIAEPQPENKLLLF